MLHSHATTYSQLLRNCPSLANALVDPPQYSSHGVRERTQELASYALESETYQGQGHRPSFTDTDTISSRKTGLHTEYGEGRTSFDSFRSDVSGEAAGLESPETVIGVGLRRNDDGFFQSKPHSTEAQNHGIYGTSSQSSIPGVVVEDAEPPSEITPLLLPRAGLPRSASQPQLRPANASSNRLSLKTVALQINDIFVVGGKHLTKAKQSILNPKNYTKDAAAAGAVASLQTLSAVFLGLLLNILDALSYGYILFPLGSSIFSQTGPDGISIFFVSCIVSQLSYSLGLSVFRGGVGSEMIEVVPFFHKMAFQIIAEMEGESNEAVMATVIVAYCLSSIVTGLIFLALGSFKLGSLVSFFPRHILIGCIGGVGFFLIVTGIEVSARLDGNLNYDLPTLHKLFSSDTIYLWVLPLALAIVLLVLRRLLKSPFVLPIFFILIFATFYLIVKGILGLDLQVARDSGWIFEQPEAGVPFYRFYSYFSTWIPMISRAPH